MAAARVSACSPNPIFKPEESKDWEVGVNVFKEGLLFGDDRLGHQGGLL